MKTVASSPVTRPSPYAVNVSVISIQFVVVSLVAAETEYATVFSISLLNSIVVSVFTNPVPYETVFLNPTSVSNLFAMPNSACASYEVSSQTVSPGSTKE